MGKSVGFKCKCCGDTKNTLHCHHKKYEPGKDPWDIDPNKLITLCEKCHEIVSQLPKAGGIIPVEDSDDQKRIFKLILTLFRNGRGRNNEITKAWEKLYNSGIDVDMTITITATGK